MKYIFEVKNESICLNLRYDTTLNTLKGAGAPPDFIMKDQPRPGGSHQCGDGHGLQVRFREAHGYHAFRKNHGRMIPFYDTPKFNCWSVSNFDVLHRHPQQDTEHYKAQLKEKTC